MIYFKGYGGPVNDFLSWGLWQPISKISFMTYFFHMSSGFYYFAAQVDKDFFSFGFFIVILGDLEDGGTINLTHATSRVPSL